MIWTTFDHADSQGLAFYAYAEQSFSKYLHVALAHRDPRTFEWLRALIPSVRHTGHASDRDLRESARETVQVALTPNGLRAFGLTHEDLQSLPREYLLGMNDDISSRRLRDSHADWEFGAKRHAAIDAVIMLYARSEAGLAKLVAEHERRLGAAGVRILHSDEARLFPDFREHFGFRDGISDPHVEGGPRDGKKHPRDQSVPLGELLLGHKDAYGETVAPPKVRDFALGANGTFVVYRKLRQHVGSFWAAMREQVGAREEHSDAAIRLAASMVGRWPDGRPVVQYPDGPPLLPRQPDPTKDSPPNDFSYRTLDPNGHRCPFGAHMRRANPRDMLEPSASESLKETSRHRLFRRGRPYGPRVSQWPPWQPGNNDDKEVDRGLVFIALCASLRRQFEFIQQTWTSSYKFAGLQDERDPILGGVGSTVVEGRLDGRGLFTIQGEPVRRCIEGLPRFVVPRGGAYFFLPGIRALKWLATLDR